MYEAGPLGLRDFMAMLQHDGYSMFRRFDDMPVNRTFRMKLGKETQGKMLDDI